MTSRFSHPKDPLAKGPSAFVFRAVATVVAGLLCFFVFNAVRSDSDTALDIDLSTASLLTVPGVAAPTEIPTTAPVQFPTATAIPEPTATPLPTATAVPTAAPTPLPTTPPTPTTPPEPELVASTSSAAVAGESAEAPNEAVPNPVAPTAVVPDPVAPSATSVPNPVAPPATSVPNSVAPSATSVPNPVPSAATAVVPNQAAPTATSVPNPVAPAATATAVPQVAPQPTPTTPAPPTATAVPIRTVADLEAYVLGEINGVRAQAGLAPLTLDPAISNISRDWSRQMAVGGFFQHRPGDQISAMLPAGWRGWGENIASAPDIFWAQSSLESSPGHYANMVGDFTHVGIGVYSTGSQVWLTHNFARY